MSSIFPYLGLPSLFQLCLPLYSLCRFPDLQLYSFPRSQYLTLEIEASPLSRIISIEHGLEPFHHEAHVCFAALWWLDVEDLACFVEGNTGRDGTAGGTRTARVSTCSPSMLR